MNFLIIEITIWVILAAIIGFMSAWLLRIWPFWKRFRDYEKSFENSLQAIDRKIKQVDSDFSDKLKIFQIKYEERMRKFQTDYENGLNNFQEDYADSYSVMKKNNSELESKIQEFKNEIEHKLTEYSSKYYYLERKFREDLKNPAYEITMDAMEDKIAKIENQLKTKPAAKKSTKLKVVSKKKPTTRKKKISSKEKDNLQLITGIGKAVEQMLNKQKVYSFKQLADMSKQDVELISKKIAGFGEKVKKYKWVQQAKKLMKKK